MSMFRTLLLDSKKSYNIYGVKRELSSSSPTWTRLESGVGLTANATHDGTAVVNIIEFSYLDKIGEWRWFNSQCHTRWYCSS